MCNIKETLARFAKEAIETESLEALEHLLTHLVEAIAIILAPFGKDVQIKCVLNLVAMMAEEQEVFAKFREKMDDAGIPPDAEITPAIRQQAMAFIQTARKPD